MLDTDTFNKFIKKANPAHQQLCVWFAANNEYAKHQKRWNVLDPEIGPFDLKEFTRKHGCRYKNFWPIVVPVLQHGWVLSTARLFDSAYNSRDKKKERPRISLDFVLSKLDDKSLSDTIREELQSHQTVISSLREHRDNFHAHNDANFSNTTIEAGVEKLFEWLEEVIARIKISQPHLRVCGVINIDYNEKISKCGVEEVFEAILLSEKYIDLKMANDEGKN